MLILTGKVKNAFKRANKDYTFTLYNILVNGQKRGCSGFIRNGGKVVYINTEPIYARHLPSILYRSVKDENDYRGDTNNFAKNLDELVKGVEKLLAA